jgi:hypothetical protein
MSSPAVRFTFTVALAAALLQGAHAQPAAPATPVMPTPDATAQAPAPGVISRVIVSETPSFTAAGPVSLLLLPLGGAVGGAIVGGLSALADQDEPTRIANFVRQEQIDVGAMLQAEFERQLPLNPAALRILQKKGPGRWEIRTGYGLIKTAFSDFRPIMHTELRLMNEEGTRLWSGGGSGGGKAKDLLYGEYFKPAVFRDQFQAAAREAAGKLVNELVRQDTPSMNPGG